MTTIERITDLTVTTTSAVDWNFNGWETSSANAGDVVVYTYNTGAAFSVDGGATFHVMDANALCQAHDASLSGDQVVMYSPYLERFVWVLLTTAQDLVIAVASASDIKSSNGTAWLSWLIPAVNFGDHTSLFDRPTVACGFRFTYIAVNLGRISIAIRLHNSEIAEAQPLHLGYIVAPDVFWLRATENAGDTGHFAALMYVTAENRREYISNLRVFEWPENANAATYFDIPIAAVPTEGGTVDIPSGQWLAKERGSLQVLGITRRTNELWMAWWANRTVKDPPAPTHEFPQPHIEIAVVDLNTRTLKTQLYMWNPDVAFVYPDLAASSQGSIGLAFCWGGPQYEPQVGIGVLTWPTTWPITSHWSVTPSPTLGAGGDYITIRRSYSPGGAFCAAGFTQAPPDSARVNHPYYIVFSP